MKIKTPIAHPLLLLISLVSFPVKADEKNPNALAVSRDPMPKPSTIELGEEWMHGINGKLLLSELSIPGTHDSCALHNGFSFGYAKCQSWQLDSQLKAGVRYLDIRCRHQSDRFQIYHGIIDQKIAFSRVVEICLSFLVDHPSECLILSIKEESSPEATTRTFKETFEEEIESSKNKWLISPETPTLHQSRGRLILVDRVGNLGGLAWGEMNLQDDYQALPEVKKIKIKQHFDTISGRPKKDWFLNYCSGTVPRQLINPATYAAIINPFVLNQVQRRAGNRLGVVVMDFPGDSLVRKIIESNFSKRTELEVDDSAGKDVTTVP